MDFFWVMIRNLKTNLNTNIGTVKIRNKKTNFRLFLLLLFFFLGKVKFSTQRKTEETEEHFDRSGF